MNLCALMPVHTHVRTHTHTHTHTNLMTVNLWAKSEYNILPSVFPQFMLSSLTFMKKSIFSGFITFLILFSI